MALLKGYNVLIMILDDFKLGNTRIVINQSIQSIHRYTQGLASEGERICVDLGASDGLNQSNTLWLYFKGWSGLSLDSDPTAMARLHAFYAQHLPQVQTQLLQITPENICSVLNQAQIPKDFAFLSLDIDSFDYDVLNTLLSEYRPTIICAEINEKFPPPIFFKVNFRPEHTYSGDHFYGMSLSALSELAQRHDYQVVELCFNNLFLIAKESNRWPVLDAEEAYKNYRLGPKPLWNHNVAELLTLEPQAALKFIGQLFADYPKESYQLGLYCAETPFKII